MKSQRAIIIIDETNPNILSAADFILESAITKAIINKLKAPIILKVVLPQDIMNPNVMLITAIIENRTKKIFLAVFPYKLTR